MIDLQLYAAFFLVGAVVVLTVMSLVVTVILPDIDRWSRNFFIALFSVLLLYSGVILLDGLIFRRPDAAVLTLLIFDYLESLLVSLLLPMLTVYLLHSCGEEPRKSPLLRAVLALWLVYFLLISSTLFSSWFYYYPEPGRIFTRGPLYPLVLLPTAVILMLDLVTLIRRRDRLSRRSFHAFLVGLLPITVGIIVNMFVFAWTLFGVTLFLCAFSQFIMILFDQVEQTRQRQQEIANQHASITMLRMRPHFIYNTMTSIYYLCDQDPQKAKQVTLDFTSYLRRNFNTIAGDKPIPFSEELEHTRAYLAVEQAQFEGSLFVEYDTPDTAFSLPPLTLQPIVENAVKHGMDPDSGPLRISVRTRITDDGHEITVADNGPGFDPARIEEPKATLDNIRQRLKMMCRGSLTISASDTGGTAVRLTIPPD